MKHFASPRFWGCYHKLPKKIGNLWSVRVGAHFRALALDKDGDLLWFWIGSHADYDKILR